MIYVLYNDERNIFCFEKTGKIDVVEGAGGVVVVGDDEDAGGRQ